MVAMETSTLAQSAADLYRIARTGTDAECAAAGRTAIDTDGHAFDDLTGEGDSDLVAHEAADDAKVLRAIADLGDLEAGDAEHFGQYLAEQLVENAVQAEADHWLGRYRAERHHDAPAADQADAYEPEDPKNPRNQALAG